MSTDPVVPTYNRLMWPALKALKAVGGSAQNEELLAKLIEMEHITEAAASRIHTDNRQTRLSYNLAWAKTNLKWIGAIENSSRGVWSLTEKGDRITENEMNAEHARVRDELRRRGREISVAQSASEDHEPDQFDVPDRWKDRLLSVLHDIQPSAFERLSQRLLREAGFVSVRPGTL